MRGGSAGQRLQLIAEVPDIATAEDLPQLGSVRAQLVPPRAEEFLQLGEDVTVGHIPYDDLRVGAGRRTEDGDAAATGRSVRLPSSQKAAGSSASSTR